MIAARITITCLDAFIWNGLADAPEWVKEAVEDEQAFVAKVTRTITFRPEYTGNGYCSADIGHVIVRTNGPFPNRKNLFAIPNGITVELEGANRG